MIGGRILVTGATGFVGRALANRCALEGLQVRAAARALNTDWPAAIECVLVRDLAADNDWRPVLAGVTVVAHCAARVHVMSQSAPDQMTEMRRVNVAATLNLARQAAQAGVRRFVFISSIKVNGEGTLPGIAYTAADAPEPVGPYAISKHEAEEGLRQIARKTGLEVVIIRASLVYGPGAKGNVLSMMRWIERGIPLPFGAIKNQRSMVALDNLVDLLVMCLDHPAAANQTFLVSDGEDLSTTELLRRTAAAMSKSARLIPVPAILLRLAAQMFGRAELAQRLCGSLQVDIGKTRQLLGWTPRVRVDDALREMAREYFRQHVNAR
jgi:nucleoside-diphosphate-sugar epimerase